MVGNNMSREAFNKPQPTKRTTNYFNTPQPLNELITSIHHNLQNEP